MRGIQRGRWLARLHVSTWKLAPKRKLSWTLATHSSSSTDTAKAALITDRRLYRVNETVYVKGYARMQASNGSLSAPAGDNSDLSLSVQWSTGDGPTTVKLDLDAGALFDSVTLCAWVALLWCMRARVLYGWGP